MKALSYILIFLSLAVIPVPISAADFQEKLTWDDCVREATITNPDLLAAGMEVNQAVAEKRMTRANLLPQISADAATSTSKSSGDDQGESYSYGIEGRQLIFDGLKSWYDLDQSAQELIVAHQRYEITSMGVRLSLREAFILF